MRCRKCNVEISGSHRRCPLCGVFLPDENTKTDEISSGRTPDVFPLIPSAVRRSRFLLRLLILATACAAVICVMVNLSLPHTGFWSLLVIGGIASFWISFYLLITKMGNIPKTITWQVIIISGLALAWDLGTGFLQWSINFVIPILATCALITMAVFSRVMHLQPEDYMIYLIIDSIMGVLSLIFIAFGLLYTVIPSAICAGASAISIIVLLVFQGGSLRSEMKRRMHV